MTEKLRIAFVLEQFPVISQTFIVNQIADLISRGHQVRIFSLQPRLPNQKIHQKVIQLKLLELTTYKTNHSFSSLNYRSFARYLLTNRRSIYYPKIFRSFSLKNPKSIRNAVKAYQSNDWILCGFKPDIIHAHFGPAGIFVSKLKNLGYFSSIKFITTFHGYDLYPDTLTAIKKDYPLLFDKVDLVTVNSKYSKKLLKQINPNKRIEILPMGLDTNLFSRKNLKIKNTEEFNILFVGRLIELKGPILILEILKILRLRGVENLNLWLVGEGEMGTEINSRIEKFKLKEEVICFGALTQEEVKNLMEKSDVLILPGIHDKEGKAETQGLVIQEAQAMQIPVILSDAGGMKYGILDGETGFIVKEGDIEGFADKIQLLSENPNLKAELGTNGRNFVRENYDSKVLGERLERIYINLLK